MTVPASASKRFVNNAAVSTVLHFSSTFVVLAITPYTLTCIGLEAYGLWALLNTVIRYSLLADVGIGPSVTKHVAQFTVSGDRFTVRAINTIGTLYYLLIAGVVLGITQAAGPPLLARLTLSPALHASAQGLLTAFVGSFLLSLILWSSPSATLSGLGLFRVTAAVNAVGNLVYAAVAVTLLHMGWGVMSLIDASYAQVLSSGVIGGVVLWRMQGPPLVNPAAIPRKLFREILGFGGWLQISTVAWLVISDTPAILVGYLVGVQAVGILDIGTRLARAVRAIAFNFTSALLPAVSSLHAEAGSSHVMAMLPRAARIMGFVAFSSMGLLIGATPLLLRFWLGPGFMHERMILIVVAGLSLTYTIETLTKVAGTAANGLGKPWLDVCYSVGYAVPNVILSVLLTPHLGLPGVIVSSIGGVLCGSVAFFVASQRSGTIYFKDLFRSWLVRLSAATGVAASATLYLDSFLAPRTASRFVLFAELIVAGAAYVLTFILAQRAVGFFSDADLQALRRIVPLRFTYLLDARMTRKLFTAP